MTANTTHNNTGLDTIAKPQFKKSQYTSPTEEQGIASNIASQQNEFDCMKPIGVRDVYDDARGLIMEVQRGKSVDQTDNKF